MRLMLIRHGETPSNVIGALDTARPGPGLTTRGRAQAAAIPLALVGEQIDAVYASPLLRTQLTAAPLAEAREQSVDVVDGFEEILAGVWEMNSDMPSVRGYMRTVSSWVAGDLDAAIDGGESGHDFFGRFDAAIAKVVDRHADGAAAVVSHGAAIRVWAAARMTGVDLIDAASWRLHNTGMCMLEGDPDAGWSLVRWQQEPLGGASLD